MEVFLSYTAQGHKPLKLDSKLRFVKHCIEQRNNNVYCVRFLSENDYTEFLPVTFLDFMQNVFRRIRKSDSLYCHASSNIIGDGLMLELGCAIGAQVPIVMLAEGTVPPRLSGLADLEITYESDADLSDSIRNIPAGIELLDRPTGIHDLEASREAWSSYIRPAPQ